MVDGRGEKLAHLALAKFLQDVDLTAGEECGDDFERGIFGGGTDEGDNAAFDSTEEGVLLAFGETVDLVDEKDGAFFVLGFLLTYVKTVPFCSISSSALSLAATASS